MSVEPLVSKWEVRRLEELSSAIQYGYTAKATTEQLGPKLLRITDIQNDAVEWDDVPFCEISAKEIEKYRLGKNDLLFARTGATVGKSYLIPGSIPESVFASYLIRVRLLEEVYPKYVAYFFRSGDYWRQITENQVGIGQPNVNGTKLAQIKIPVAPLNQQRLIVAEIEKQFSRLDEAVANLKRAKANLKRYKAAVLKAAVEGKLISAGKEFQRVTLGTVCDKITDGEHQTPKRHTLGRMLLSAKNVRDGFINYADHDLIGDNDFEKCRNRCDARVGDVLLVCVGATIGRAAIVRDDTEFALVRSVALLRNSPSMLPKYLLFSIQSDSMQKQIAAVKRGSAQPCLYLNRIRNLLITLPPVDEQQRIVAEVERRLSVIEEFEAAVQANLTRPDRLRQSILGQAFSGRLPLSNGLGLITTTPKA